MSKTFKQSVNLPISAQDCFTWHERPGAFERLCPPWDPVEVLHKDHHIQDGAKVLLKVKALPGLRIKLEAEHQNYQAGVSFEDRQVKGPFADWVHTHHMEDIETHDQGIQCQLTDDIKYRLPLGILGQWGGGKMVEQRLKQLFHYRHQVMIHDTLLHSFADQASMTIAVSGARGLIGNPLCALLTTGGHKVIRLVRKSSGAEDERLWSDPHNVPDLSDVDAVIHLAGENVAQRWNTTVKDRIMKSRTLRTQALAQALADQHSQTATKTLIVASGIGYYGDSTAQNIEETASLGDGFLAQVCKEWEEACIPAKNAGIRVVNMRIGIVLTPEGGALSKLLPPFLAGVGGPVADGQQWMSWISIHDVVGAIYFALCNSELVGAVNTVAPNPVNNREFSKILAKVLSRPCLFTVPAFMLKLIYGEMAQETVLSGQHVSPKKLQDQNYPFMHDNLENALRFVLGKKILNT